MKHAMRPVRLRVFTVVLVCNQEHWEEIRQQLTGLRPGTLHRREFFSRTYSNRRVVLLRAGEGPIEAAAAAQLAIDQWKPSILMMTASGGDENEAIRHISHLNGSPILEDPIDAGVLSEVLTAMFPSADQVLNTQYRTR